MSDPFDDRLRGALRAGGDDFSWAKPPGAVRSEVVRRVARRQRQKAALAAGGVAIVLVGALAVGLGRPGHSSSRLVAASGAGASTTVGGGSPTPGPAGNTGTTGAVGVTGGTGGTGATGTGATGHRGYRDRGYGDRRRRHRDPSPVEPAHVSPGHDQRAPADDHRVDHPAAGVVGAG